MRFIILFSSVVFSIVSILMLRKTDETQKPFDRFRPVEKGVKKPQPNDYWQYVRFANGEFDIEDYMVRMQAAKDWMAESNLSRNINLSLPWVSEGPGNIGGRFNVLEQDPNNPNVIYAGAANGGVFKRSQPGGAWTPIFDAFSFLAIGAIQVDPSNSDVVWVGTGDRNFGGTSQLGYGIYKSSNGGQTWTHKGLEETSIITEIQIDPNNSNRIFVSALGNTFAKTSARGVYRTLDGGDSWQNVLFVSDSSGACDLVMDPSNSDVLYACFFNRINLPFQSRAFGPDAKIFKTTNGGDTWTQLTNGLPNGENSRVGITVSHNNPDLLYAVYVSQTYNPVDVYKSTNGGASWTSLNIYQNGIPDDVMGGFGWYFGQIHINPYNDNHLIIQGVDQYVSNDGGHSWYMNVPPWFDYDVHADKHDVLFLSASSYIIATDGGLYQTNNNGGTWLDIENIPVTQFYHIAIHPNFSGLYSGGTQDNGSISGNASVFNLWDRLFGGDGFRVTWLESAFNAAIFEYQNGGLYYINDDNGDYVDVSPMGSFPERVNWDMPYILKEAQNQLYAGTYRILKMSDFPYGVYTPISPDLTKVSTGNFVGTASRHTVAEIEADKFNSSIIYAGTNDGWVWIGNGTGSNYTWTNISTGLPDRYVTALRASPNVPGTLYAGFSGYRMNDYTPYIFKSTDYGQNWIAVHGNLPDLAINDILIVPGQDDSRLFVATDAGVFYSEDGGQEWDAVGVSIPMCTMTELALDFPNKKLVVGTFSRSMFSYDVSWLPNLDSGVGLTQNSSPEMTVYPNPTTEILKVKHINTDFYFIYSFSGKMVKSGKISNDEINVSDLNPGSYFLKIGDQTSGFIKL